MVATLQELLNQQEAENNMEYKNTKTGAIINSPCVINGGDWVTFDSTLAKKAESMVTPTFIDAVQTDTPLLSEEPQENNEAFDGITVKQIKQELDAFGIEYNPRAPKQELYDLMMQGK